MLSETIAELERLEALARTAPTVQLRAKYSDDLRDVLEAFAMPLIAAAKLSEKLPKYADTGEAFVPGVDPCWEIFKGDAVLCQPRFADLLNPPAWLTPWGKSETMYPTATAALAAAEKGGAEGESK